MDSVVSLRRAMLCLVGLLLIKVCEYLIVEPRLEQLVEQHSLNINKVNIILGIECEGCWFELKTISVLSRLLKSRIPGVTPVALWGACLTVCSERRTAR